MARKVKLVAKIRGKRDAHPSGRPIDRDVVGYATFGFNYRDEPRTPGLRRRSLENAIGFTANLRLDEDDD